MSTPEATAATVVFVGTSLPGPAAQRLLPGAEIRPPIRRGDLLPLLARGVRTVAIIDGVFHQTLAVSPREVRQALEAGVTVFGAASIGALRAAELHTLGMIGVGTVFAWYRDGAVIADDEVALLFDPETCRSLTVPLVNVRHALSRAAQEGLLTADEAAAMLTTALRTPYWELSWKALLAAIPAGAGDTRRREVVAARLARHDLKRDDAVLCLQEVAAHLARRRAAAHGAGRE